ncbi:MAG: hypothetical protein OEM39_06545 [Acidimicrobiia bacterium]|nr:hypothetical protein [Acidimicrobiia bacterium]MDH3463094.1 hypothetical protein [Acidimicrobiia bacterium]
MTNPGIASGNSWWSAPGPLDPGRAHHVDDIVDLRDTGPWLGLIGPGRRGPIVEVDDPEASIRDG